MISRGPRPCGYRSPISGCGAPGTCRRSPSACSRCSASSSPSMAMTRSIWSSIPSLVSHSAQSSAWILLWLSVTVIARSGSALRSAYSRIVIDVQAPSPASKKSYRPGAGVRAAGRGRLVGEQMMRPDGDRLLELAVAGFAHHDVARRSAGVAGRLRAAGCRDSASAQAAMHVGGIGGIGSVAQQMIRARQRDKTLGMPGRDENAGRVVDADGVVGRRVHHQQRLVQVGDRDPSDCARRCRREMRA